TKEPGEGMGLGVFLARNTIERLGGRLEVESAVQQGTQVNVHLPFDANSSKAKAGIPETSRPHNDNADL
ncbi:MAG: ATP-binding protein, partial [Planctomycetota bacterium]|nr:ATP-binding protein [Planctomycetota bacterium]